MPEEQKDWGDYRRFVLNELENISRDLKLLAEKIATFQTQELAQIKVDLALLKFQAALWGAIAGAVGTGLITLIIKLWTK